MMQPQIWFPTVRGSINACRRRWGKRLSAPNYTWIGLVTWQWKIDCFRVWGFEDFDFWRISSKKLAPELWSLAGKCSAGSLFFFLILETAGKIRSPSGHEGTDRSDEKDGEHLQWLTHQFKVKFSLIWQSGCSVHVQTNPRAELTVMNHYGWLNHCLLKLTIQVTGGCIWWW